MTAFRVERLANGVTVAFVDCSNRYFGDYHRVRVEVRICLDLAGTDAPQQVKHLERMGVPGDEVVVVSARLADDYWRHAGRYLAHPDFPARLLAATAARNNRLFAGRR